MTSDSSFQRTLEQIRYSLPNKNQNRLSLFVGGPGTGKSSGAMCIGSTLMGRAFKPEKHIALFRAWEFSRKVKAASPGDIVIFDDAGVGVSSKEWMSQSNILIGKLTQTFRTKNLWCIFTTPSINYIDKLLRPLFHDLVVFQGIDQEEEVSRAKWYSFHENKITGKLFVKNIEVSDPKYPNLKNTLGPLEFSKVPDSLTAEYDKLRKLASDDLEMEIEAFHTAGGRAITLHQVASILNTTTDLVMNLFARAQIPLDPDSKTPKVPLRWVREVVDALKITPGGSTIIVEQKKADNYKLKWPLDKGFFLVFDVEKSGTEGIPLKCLRCFNRWNYNGKKRGLKDKIKCPQCGADRYLANTLYNRFNII